MPATKIDPRTECLDDCVEPVGARRAAAHAPEPDDAPEHPAIIASATWAPASDSLAALLAVTLTAPHDPSPEGLG